jgi:hypothetical protein
LTNQKKKKKFLTASFFSFSLSSRILSEQTPGPVDLRTPFVARSAVGAPSATSSPLRVFVRVKPTDDAPCFVVAADHKTLTATAPDVRARAKNPKPF